MHTPIYLFDSVKRNENQLNGKKINWTAFAVKTIVWIGHFRKKQRNLDEIFSFLLKKCLLRQNCSGHKWKNFEGLAAQYKQDNEETLMRYEPFLRIGSARMR